VEKKQSTKTTRFSMVSPGPAVRKKMAADKERHSCVSVKAKQEPQRTDSRGGGA
jgi:hypothetical protein